MMLTQSEFIRKQDCVLSGLNKGYPVLLDWWPQPYINAEMLQ